MGLLATFRSPVWLLSDMLGFSMEKDRTLPESIKGNRGSYILCETLGQGVTSTVRAGYQVDNGSPVAVKLLDTYRLGRDLQAVERVKREIRIMQNLAMCPHPNVIALKDFARDKRSKHAFIVMEKIDGTSLQCLLDGGRRCPPSQVASIVAQTLLALRHFHGLGFVHGDIKPANILLTRSSRVRVADFGSSEVLSSAAQTCGSPAYQAPEFLDGRANESGAKVDVWALGVTAFYALAGRRPFSAVSIFSLLEKVAAGDYSFPEEVASQLSADALDAVRCMLDANFRRRWSVDQLLEHPWVRMGLEQVTDAPKMDAEWRRVVNDSRPTFCAFGPQMSRTVTAHYWGSSSGSKIRDAFRNMAALVRRMPSVEKGTRTSEESETHEFFFDHLSTCSPSPIATSIDAKLAEIPGN